MEQTKRALCGGGMSWGYVPPAGKGPFGPEGGRQADWREQNRRFAERTQRAAGVMDDTAHP